MNQFVPKDINYENRFRDSFSKQMIMQTIGVSIASVAPGVVELDFKHDSNLTQHHGFIHAGIGSTVLDSACGYAALTLMPRNTSVLTVEFKTNLLSPAIGDHYRAIGKVIKAGRTISVCEGELYAFKGEQQKLVSTMTGTLICVNDC